MTEQLNDLLAQYNKHNARGSLLAANQTMATIIETLVGLMKQPCPCACQGAGQPPVKAEPVAEPISEAEPLAEPISEAEPVAASSDDLTIPPPPPMPVKRPVGRPRKHPLPTEPHAG